MKKTSQIKSKLQTSLDMLWGYLAAIQMQDINTNEGVERFRAARTHFNDVYAAAMALENKKTTEVPAVTAKTV